MFGHMSLLRFIARGLVAGAFIVDGAKKVSRPADSAADAERFTATVAPLAQRAVPAAYSSWVPESAESWVRLTGGAQIVGGVMFATGIGRRLGALILAKSSLLDIAIACPAKGASKEEKAAARPEVLMRLALLGSTLLAALDLQGKPSLAWRSEHAAAPTEPGEPARRSKRQRSKSAA